MNEYLTQLPTEPFTVEREWTVDGIPVLYADISLPRPVQSDSRIARRIRRYYQLQCRAYLRYCEGWLLPQAAAEYYAALEASRPLPAVHARLEYCVTWQQDGLWSLYTQSRESGLPGQPHLLTRRGDTWDLAAGYPVPPQRFFSGGNWKKELLHAVEDSVQRQMSAGAASYYEGWHRALRRHLNPQNYYLTADGFTFFYPVRTIAPATMGIPTFTIPYSSLRDFPHDT